MQNNETLEILSKYIHEEMWSKWASEILSTEDISRERSIRWKNLFVPYENLSEDMKDLDRMFASKIVGLLENESNSYLNDRKAIDRLKKEYLEHKNLVIGFDFDCTIFDYHKEGLEVQPIIDVLKKCSDLGFTLCVFSNCPTDDDVKFKQDHLINLNLNVTYFNESPLCKNQSQIVPRKPHFSILLDDRAGLSASYNILKTTLNELGL